MFEWRPILFLVTAVTSGQKVGAERKGEERVTRRKPVLGGEDKPGQEPLLGSSAILGALSPAHLPLLASPRGRVFPFLNPKSFECILPSMMVELLARRTITG